METKSKRIKLSKADKYVELQESFGWELSSKEDLRPDNTIFIVLERDRNNFQDYGRIRALEKQYEKINRPIPIREMVVLGIGLALLIAYLFFKNTLVFSYLFLYGALTFFCIDVFLLIIWLILFIKKEKLLAAIKLEASNKSGANKDWPTPRNIAPEEEMTWAIYDSVNKR